MSVAARPLPALESTYATELADLVTPWKAAGASDPTLLVLNEELAAELGADPEALASPEGVAVLAGNRVPEGATPVAQAYAGHQFGGFSPRLGDGRALLLGEVLDVHGQRRDLHLKGSGRTPYARGGDGKAAVGPMLREFVVGEAMHALGIPTTRALAVVATGEAVVRETLLPGAVLTRVAASHLRVGTFEWAAAHGDRAQVQRLADYAIARHHPAAAAADEPYLAFLEAVIEAQAELVARWMLVGFVHGVMNTDNMTISGETIDYGPCAFLDAFDPVTAFSSIDHAGRYAWGNQPAIAQWNLSRLAGALLPLLGPTQDAAVTAAQQLLEAFPARHQRAWEAGMRAKLGLAEAAPGDTELFAELLTLMHEHEVDLTSTFRALSDGVRGDLTAARLAFGPGLEAFDAWAARWLARVGEDRAEVAVAMDRVNPVYIPRNHLVEEALASATAGDLAPFGALLEVLRHPFEERPGLEAYAVPAPAGDGPYRTFCGT
ncbi:MAG: YdiU family protein [Solirubrobacterales bacterium]|jgi:uncharacterized protein YdiU (UPF0061 family)|nr:YdiU family protein [Solirubrobacterales bacterium]